MNLTNSDHSIHWGTIQSNCDLNTQYTIRISPQIRISSIMELSLDTNQGKKKVKAKSKRLPPMEVNEEYAPGRQNYPNKEAMLLAKCLVDISDDPIYSNNQRQVAYWERITKRFKENKPYSTWSLVNDKPKIKEGIAPASSASKWAKNTARRPREQRRADRTVPPMNLSETLYEDESSGTPMSTARRAIDNKSAKNKGKRKGKRQRHKTRPRLRLRHRPMGTWSRSLGRGRCWTHTMPS